MIPPCSIYVQSRSLQILTHTPPRGLVLLCSVKAMLLLIDCKDYMVLTNTIASLNGTVEGNEDRKKEVNGPSLEVGVRRCPLSFIMLPLQIGVNGSFIDYGDVGKRVVHLYTVHCPVSC